MTDNDHHQWPLPLPPDDVERYVLEDYLPHILPSFLPYEPVNRNATVAFEDRRGVRCTIASGEIVSCFLAIEDLGLVPPVHKDWHDLIPADLRPEQMLARPFYCPLPLPPERHDADPAQYPAQLAGLAYSAEPFGCRCCGARCHGIFRTPVSEHRIEVWSVIAAMRQLAIAAAVPMLPPFWEQQLARYHEHIGETGIRILRSRGCQL